MARSGLLVLACLSLAACSFDTSNLYQGESAPGATDGAPDITGDSGVSQTDAAPGTPDSGTLPDASESPNDPCDATSPDLIVCMQFEDTPGSTTLLDESQYGNNAVVSNAAFAAGHDGQALQGRSDFSSLLAKSASLDTENQLTIEMWINPDQDIDGGRWGLFDNNGQYGFFLGDGNELRCSTSGGPNVTSPEGVVTALQWQHVACTYDGSSIVLYVNGTEVASANGTGSMSTDGNDGAALAQDSPDGDEFLGRMDTLRVWNVGRSRAELCAGAGLSCP